MFCCKYLNRLRRFTKRGVPLLVYGINPEGRTASIKIRPIRHIPYRLAGYVTPDAGAAGKMLNKVPVYHDDGDIESIIKKTGAGALLIDPFRLSQETKQHLAEACLKLGVALLCLSAVRDRNGADAKNPCHHVRKAQIEDLLGRTSLYADIQSLEKSLKGKRFLVTGAAGSIGSEIARQLARFQPLQIILCDVAETPLYQLLLELQERHPACQIVPFLGDVRDKAQMDLLFDRLRPEVVFHAAAYKHVTMMELMPCQSVTTNIMGTMNLADLSVAYNAETFVMISSDKAVNPANVMGTSKRIAEIYVQSLSQKLGADPSAPASGDKPRTRFITTRFGNVLGSNGSVVPIFEQQIEQGGPLTVTHPDVFRYFMTIPEACGLVLEAANMGKNGEVFVLDMGRPMKIRELAEKMIRLSGYEPYKDIDIVFTGLRPGEKLSEELLYDKETVEPTYNPKILIGQVQRYDYDHVFPKLEKLVRLATDGNKEETVRQMKAIVPEFVSNNSSYESLQPAPEAGGPASEKQRETVTLGMRPPYAHASGR